jgi:hypothetical protein
MSCPVFVASRTRALARSETEAGPTSSDQAWDREGNQCRAGLHIRCPGGSGTADLATLFGGRLHSQFPKSGSQAGEVTGTLARGNETNRALISLALGSSPAICRLYRCGAGTLQPYHHRLLRTER